MQCYNTVHHNYTETQTRPKSPHLVGKPRGGDIGSRMLHRLMGCFCFITALHAMQTRSSDENSVCPFVCLSHACIVTKR